MGIGDALGPQHSHQVFDEIHAAGLIPD